MKKNIIKNIFKKENITTLLSAILFFYSIYEQNFIGMLFSAFALILSVIKIKNTLIRRTIITYRSNKKYEWLIVTLRSLKNPITAILFISLFGIEYKIISQKINITEYNSLAIDFVEYSLIFIFCWFLFRLSSRAKQKFINDINDELNELSDSEEDKKRNLKYKTTTTDAIFKSINFSIITIIILIFFQKLGVSLSGLMAFGGMSGIVVGFACKDLLANLFGGIIVYMNRTFDIGDWVRSPDREIEGVVEEIGWFITKVKTFDRRPIYIPNAIFASISVENPSRMTHRRIKEIIKLRIKDIDVIPEISKHCKNIIAEHAGIDNEELLIFNLNTVSNGYAEMFLCCYTKTTKIEHYFSIKQDLLTRISNGIKEKGGEMAINTLKIE